MFFIASGVILLISILGSSTNPDYHSPPVEGHFVTEEGWFQRYSSAMSALYESLGGFDRILGLGQIRGKPFVMKSMEFVLKGVSRVRILQAQVMPAAR